jgi:hypothetical protein
MQYTQDYDETMLQFNLSNNSTLAKWQDVVQPYVKSTQLFNCPSDSQNGTYVFPPAGRGGNRLGSYIFNYAYVSNEAGQPRGAHGRPLSVFEDPAQTLLVGETNN